MEIYPGCCEITEGGVSNLTSGSGVTSRLEDAELGFKDKNQPDNGRRIGKACR